MMEWQEYISRILADSASFDGISLSFGEAEEFAVPPIIIRALDKAGEWLQIDLPVCLLEIDDHIEESHKEQT